MELFFFLLFGIGAAAAAIYVIFAKSPMNSAISLIVVFLCLAGLYVLLNAHFIAIIQLLVYAGAIMVLFLFVIMLLNLGPEDLGERRVNAFKLLGVGLAGAVLVMVAGWFLSAEQPLPHGQTRVLNSAIAESYGGIERVGTLLFEEYVLPFEVVSILLLVAIVGSLWMARKRA